MQKEATTVAAPEECGWNGGREKSEVESATATT